jgi:hypothetical protein
MKQHSKNSKPFNRTKKFAATVAALGAAIGVNMGDVLAGAADLQVTERGKTAISSQKIKKPDVRADKTSARELKKRPAAVGAKVERPGLKNRPDTRADKSSRNLQNRPGSRNR